MGVHRVARSLFFSNFKVFFLILSKLKQVNAKLVRKINFFASIMFEQKTRGEFRVLEFPGWMYRVAKFAVFMSICTFSG